MSVKTRKARAIRITCDGADYMPLAALRNFQGGLKKLSPFSMAKLRRSIEKHGFAFPVFVWRDSQQKQKCYIIDGHQRVAVVRSMLRDGAHLEGGRLPVVWIHAETLKEAKEKVLLAISQYGHYDQDSVAEFLDASSLEFDAISPLVDLSSIDLQKLADSFTKAVSAKQEAPIPEDRVEFKVLIVCNSEKHQRDLLKEFEKRKIECRALMF